MLSFDEKRNIINEEIRRSIRRAIQQGRLMVDGNKVLFLMRGGQVFRGTIAELGKELTEQWVDNGFMLEMFLEETDKFVKAIDVANYIYDEWNKRSKK